MGCSASTQRATLSAAAQVIHLGSASLQPSQLNVSAASGKQADQQGRPAGGEGAAPPVSPPKTPLGERASALRSAEQALASNVGHKLRDVYVRATLVSYGASCRVFTAVNKHTNEKVAIKTISKSCRHPEEQRARVLCEVGAMQLLQGHPHVVRLLDVYEDERSYHLVMEHLAGGELFEHISRVGSLTEAAAAELLRALLLFLAHAHGCGLAHMDIKPENIMFDSEGAAGVLKVIDLGSSEFLGPGELAGAAFGTVRYSSPEMAVGQAGCKSDVWSAGVVIYQVLAGRPPFLRSKESDTLALIRKGPSVSFTGKRWKDISQAAKDCIRALLQPDPARRPGAAEALAQAWLARGAPHTAIAPATLLQLQQFSSLNRARRIMLGVMARDLSGGEASRLLRDFLALDTDFSGQLDFQELHAAVREAAPELGEPQLRSVFGALDVDNTGGVDYQEFFAALLAAAALPPHVADAAVERSFRRLDRHSRGFLTREGLHQALQTAAPAAFQGDAGSGLAQELDEEFAAMDANGDGVVTLEEFRAALTPVATSPTPRLAASPSSPASPASLGSPLGGPPGGGGRSGHLAPSPGQGGGGGLGNANAALHVPCAAV